MRNGTFEPGLSIVSVLEEKITKIPIIFDESDKHS